MWRMFCFKWPLLVQATGHFFSCLLQSDTECHVRCIVPCQHKTHVHRLNSRRYVRYQQFCTTIAHPTNSSRSEVPNAVIRACSTIASDYWFIVKVRITADLELTQLSGNLFAMSLIYSRNVSHTLQIRRQMLRKLRKITEIHPKNWLNNQHAPWFVSKNGSF